MVCLWLGASTTQYYPHTNTEDECQVIDDEKKYHIAGYEKPTAYNKLGLFDLVMRGPTAVTLGLDPEFFQYYRNDREEGPYFDTAFWRPSVYGVVVEYLQYAVEGEPDRDCVPATLSCSDCPSVRPLLMRTSLVLLVSPFVPS
ncbi:hypothetical protein BLSTO_06391 [Blastocystis sp. subtype 1]